MTKKQKIIEIILINKLAFNLKKQNPLLYKVMIKSKYGWPKSIPSLIGKNKIKEAVKTLEGYISISTKLEKAWFNRAKDAAYYLLGYPDNLNVRYHSPKHIRVNCEYLMDESVNNLCDEWFKEVN